ncbi:MULTISPECIES: DUF6281 family protein [Streptomyces]|uniref:DUF6281 family protein n=1 Tax=Streptomyces TaxID=1883 RepID=UPI0020CA7FEC|nr:MULTISPECIES: DUF6281 family protein [unclassified Streptomyces]
MSWSERSAGALLAAAMVLTVTGCTADGSSEGEASCAFEVSYEGRTYKDVANVDFTVTDKLGTATLPPCDDTGSQEETEGEESKEPAYGVKGLSPETAIAVGNSPDEAVLVVSYNGTELPPEVQKLIDNP